MENSKVTFYTCLSPALISVVWPVNTLFTTYNTPSVPSTDVIQLTLTLKMTTKQVVETSFTVNNSPIQDYVHPDNQTQPTFEMTPGFKPFTTLLLII